MSEVDKIERAGYQKVYPHNAPSSAVVELEDGFTENLSSLSSSLRELISSARPQAEELVAFNIAKEHHEQLDTLVKVIEANRHQILTIKQETDKQILQSTALLDELRDYVQTQNRAMNAAELIVYGNISKKIEQLQNDFQNTTGQDRDFFYVVHAEILKAYGQQLREGRIVEVPQVQEVINKDILPILRNGDAVELHGDTGAGKTEIARVAAKIFSDGKDPIVVRCYPAMQQEELFGHLTLTTEGLKKARDIFTKHRTECAALREEHEFETDEKFEEASDAIMQRLIHENRASVIDYVLGAQYIAMHEGRVIIYDEANAMHDTLRRKLNDLRTKRIGESVNVQEDGGLKLQVAKGYGLIKTLNRGARYGEGTGGRIASTPDEADRDQGSVEYSYLPQAIKGGFEEISSHKDKQQFIIAISALLDENGNMLAPKGTLNKLWVLAQYAALTQEAFMGTIGPDYHFKQGGVKVPVRTDLLISPRGLQSILSMWRNNGFEFELDHYLAKNFINRAKDPTQKAYLYQLGQSSGLYKGNDWEECPEFPAGRIPAFKVSIPENQAEKLEFVSVLEIIEAIWGKAPERTMLALNVGGKAEVKVLTDPERAALRQNATELLSKINGRLEA
jgi:hypothetical protein